MTTSPAALPPSASRFRAVAPALAAATVAAAVYLPTLGNELVWDDRLDILANPRVHSIRHALDYFSQLHGIYYRPLIFLTFAMEHAVWGDRAWGYHLTNLLLHALNVFLLVRVAIREAEGGSRLRGSRLGPELTANRQPLTAFSPHALLMPMVALTAGLLFALHPLQTDAVAYVSGRTDLLMTTGALLAWYALHAEWAANTRGIIAAVGTAIAIFSKETGFALVPLIVWCGLRRERDWGRRWRVAVPSLLVGTALLLTRPDRLPWPAEGAMPFTGIVAAGRTLWTYLTLLLWPAGLQIDRLTPSSGSLLNDSAAVVAIFLVSLGALWGLLRGTATAEWVAWTVALYLPVANLVALYPAIAERWLFTPEHNLYAPLAGLTVIVAAAICRARAAAAAQRLTGALVSVILLACMARTVVRLGDWRDEATLFARAAAQGSASPRVWYNHGNALAHAGAWSVASEAYRTALHLAPHDVDAWANLGVALQQQGQLDAAIDAYTKAASLAPPSAVLLENLGTAQLRHGDVTRARASFARALSIDPQREVARKALAAIDQQ